MHAASADVFPVHAGRPRANALLLPTGGVLLLNALRVRNCDPVQGVVFWLLIPAVSIVVGQALAWAAGAIAVTDRTGARVPAELFQGDAEAAARAAERCVGFEILCPVQRE